MHSKFDALQLCTLDIQGYVIPYLKAPICHYLYFERKEYYRSFNIGQVLLKSGTLLILSQAALLVFREK